MYTHTHTQTHTFSYTIYIYTCIGISVRVYTKYLKCILTNILMAFFPYHVFKEHFQALPLCIIIIIIFFARGIDHIMYCTGGKTKLVKRE